MVKPIAVLYEVEVRRMRLAGGDTPTNELVLRLEPGQRTDEALAALSALQRSRQRVAIVIRDR